ncbi:hypothetical protein Tco_0830210 [Tanacetum coccineum]
MLALQAEEGEGLGNPSEPQPPPSTAQPTHEEPIPNIESSSPQKTQSPRQALNKDTELPQTSVPIPNVPDEAVHQERGDSVERATTTATILEVVHDSRNMAKTQSTEIPTEPISQETGSDGGLRHQETIGSASVQTRFERESKLSYNSPLGGDRVLALETNLRHTKKVYGTAYTKLIMKVKKLEKTVKTSQARRRAKMVVSDDDMDSEDSSKQGRMIEKIYQDAGVTLVTPTKLEFTLIVEEEAISTGSGGVSTASRTVSTAGMIQQVNIIIPSLSATKDKEDEWEDIRARVEADEELTQKLKAEGRDKYSKVDPARMLVDLITLRKRYFAAQKAEAKRNKPMTQAQQRTYMSNYIKHMGSHTIQQLKRYTFDELKELFETTMKHANTFTSIETEDKERESKLAAGSSKTPRAEHDEQHDKESVKKQKLKENNAEKEELRACLDIVSGDEIAMDFESLAMKYPIIDWKTHILTENIIYYQIIRADGSSKNYKIFSKMLDDFDRQDVVDLYRLVQERYETTSPEGYDLLLWGDLKTLFEPCEEDEV